MLMSSPPSNPPAPAKTGELGSAASSKPLSMIWKESSAASTRKLSGGDRDKYPDFWGGQRVEKEGIDGQALRFWKNSLED